MKTTTPTRGTIIHLTEDMIMANKQLPAQATIAEIGLSLVRANRLGLRLHTPSQPSKTSLRTAQALKTHIDNLIKNKP